MAFVFETQRWNQKIHTTQLGPGYYNPSPKSKTLGGFITPEASSTKQDLSRKQSLTNYQNQTFTMSFEKSKRYHHHSSKKLFKRAMSAKVYNKKNQFNQNNLYVKPSKDNACLDFEISNFSNIKKVQPEILIPSTSFKKSKKTKTSDLENQSSNKPFNDKNIRTLGSISQKIVNSKKENHQFFNQCLNKSSITSNTKLAIFCQSQKKSQNFFSAINSMKSQKIQKENFLIASRNCIKENPSYVTSSSLGDSKFNEKPDPFDDTTNFEDSFEFITDATPGPGQYELSKEKPFFKSKIEKFGVLQQRFRQSNKREQKNLNLNAEMPSFKKSSKAPQEKVAFGKKRPQTAKQTVTNFLSYEDHQNIESRCIRNLVKDRQAPGTFLSRCDRFRPQKTQTYFGPDFFQKDKPNPITLPNSTFMSKLSRHQRTLSPTANIDFKGQDVMTIEKKIEKIIEKKQLFESQLPGFDVSEPRFRYQGRQENHETLNEVSQNSLGKKNQSKTYTFKKESVKKQEQQSDRPGPWTYSTDMEWMKPSHHVKYKF